VTPLSLAVLLPAALAASRTETPGGWDAPSVSLGPTVRDDHAAADRSWSGGVSGNVEVPVTPALGVRVDAVSAWDTRGALGVRGPMVDVLAVWRRPFGVWAVDIAAGPGLWIGRSRYWSGAYAGPFPAWRGAVGTGVRPHRNLGLRAEIGCAGGWGTRPLLTGHSSGLDARLMVTGVLRRPRPAPDPSVD